MQLHHSLSQCRGDTLPIPLASRPGPWTRGVKLTALKDLGQRQAHKTTCCALTLIDCNGSIEKRSISTPSAAGAGHTALLHSLGPMGDVPPALTPWLLRLTHVLTQDTGKDAKLVLTDNACGLLAWQAALQRGLLPDAVALQQLLSECHSESWAAHRTPTDLIWPPEPLHTMLTRVLAKLGVAHFAAKYPTIREALLRGLMELSVRYYRLLKGEQDEEQAREVDADGNRARTVSELMREEAEKRMARGPVRVGHMSEAMTAMTAKIAAERALSERQATRAAAAASLPPERRIAMTLVKDLYLSWGPPLEAMSRAGRAFEGLEALLGAQSFDLQSNIWKRPGWTSLDTLRRKLEDLKELRDLVRSLGRGGGWGPLRRAPIQHLDFHGRPGLLRTVLEAQETRGLTRSGDISRLLPAEAAMVARGRTVRSAKLLFYARLAEKALQSYERDGWGEFPTRINPDRREVRPTADRGPILLCVDTSGSMRGPRETVAKALALECMRAAKEQERACYVFAFAGPSEVRELELNADMKSVTNLLDFLEKIFNGGSDFNEPIRRCLDRLTNAKWANSDILLVSDGELRAPGSEIMRKLWGAKDKLSLRVHGLIVGSPDKKRADPAVLRSLCTAILPNGRSEILVSEFTGWTSVQADSELGQIDFDDLEGNSQRRLAGLAHEKARQEESRRLRGLQRAEEARFGRGPKNDPMKRMPSDGSGSGRKVVAGKKH